VFAAAVLLAIMTTGPGSVHLAIDRPLSRYLDYIRNSCDLPLTTLHSVETRSDPRPSSCLLLTSSSDVRHAFERQSTGRDSLRNGALIGAIVAGIGAGLFINQLCENVSEEGDGPCWKPALVFAGLGAGAGALVGAGIDALVQRGFVVQASVPLNRLPGRRRR
jgi:hypothetical protein